ncbi:unnamed protein product, partial [Ixodes pacificus]
FFFFFYHRRCEGAPAGKPAGAGGCGRVHAARRGCTLAHDGKRHGSNGVPGRRRAASLDREPRPKATQKRERPSRRASVGGAVRVVASNDGESRSPVSSHARIGVHPSPRQDVPFPRQRRAPAASQP